MVKLQDNGRRPQAGGDADASSGWLIWLVQHVRFHFEKEPNRPKLKSRSTRDGVRGDPVPLAEGSMQSAAADRSEDGPVSRRVPNIDGFYGFPGLLDEGIAGAHRGQSAIVCVIANGKTAR